MHLRTPPGLTLSSLAEEVSRPGEVRSVVTTAGDVVLRLTEEQPTISVEGHAVPATREGTHAFGDWLKVPTPFHKRIRSEIGPEFEEHVLSTLLRRVAAAPLLVTISPAGVHDVRDVGQLLIERESLVEVAIEVLGEGAPVQRLVNTSAAFAFDACVPVDEGRGVVVGQAPEGAQVGDVTAGGLRIEMDRKRNLAPSAQPWVYRLVCTNGMGMIDPGLKIDARGASVEQVLADFRFSAERAFSRVEEQIGHFYELRDRRIDNPERVLRSVARENGVPTRTLTHLLDLAASADMPDEPTLFDVVNLITNYANDPSVRRDGARVLLENVGGAIVIDQAARCAHCRARLVN